MTYDFFPLSPLLRLHDSPFNLLQLLLYAFLLSLRLVALLPPLLTLMALPPRLLAFSLVVLHRRGPLIFEPFLSKSCISLSFQQPFQPLITSWTSCASTSIFFFASCFLSNLSFVRFSEFESAHRHPLREPAKPAREAPFDERASVFCSLLSRFRFSFSFSLLPRLLPTATGGSAREAISSDVSTVSRHRHVFFFCHPHPAFVAAENPLAVISFTLFVTIGMFFAIVSFKSPSVSRDISEAVWSRCSRSYARCCSRNSSRHNTNIRLSLSWWYSRSRSCLSHSMVRAALSLSLCVCVRVPR